MLLWCVYSYNTHTHSHKISHLDFLSHTINDIPSLSFSLLLSHLPPPPAPCSRVCSLKLGLSLDGWCVDRQPEAPREEKPNWIHSGWRRREGWQGRGWERGPDQHLLPRGRRRGWVSGGSDPAPHPTPGRVGRRSPRGLRLSSANQATSDRARTCK